MESQSQELEMRRSVKDVATAAEVINSPSQSSAAVPLQHTVQSESIEDITNASRSTITFHGSGTTTLSTWNSEGSLQYPRQSLWQGRHCKLLNEDLSVFRKAQIQVCMLEEPFDEDPLGDYDVGVIFMSEGDDHV